VNDAAAPLHDGRSGAGAEGSKARVGARLKRNSSRKAIPKFWRCVRLFARGPCSPYLLATARNPKMTSATVPKKKPPNWIIANRRTFQP
jgi:hypothetical protein